MGKEDAALLVLYSTRYGTVGVVRNSNLIENSMNVRPSFCSVRDQKTLREDREQNENSHAQAVLVGPTRLG
jgi:uncharacterized protein (UPF0218 family)